jgi:hypothetical protein
MDSPQKMPHPNIPINKVWAAVHHENGEPLDLVITWFPYRTEISILRINQLHNDNPTIC